LNQIIHFLTWHGGLVLFLAVFAEQSGVPVPAAPWLLASGALAASGQLNLISAISWTATACVLADAFWFYAGHRAKARLLPLFARWHGARRAEPRITGVKATLRALRILTAAKFLPLGTLVPLRAGTLDISPLRFLLWDTPSSLIYASVYLLLGFCFHDQLERLTLIVLRLGTVGLLAVLMFVGMYVAWAFVRHNRVKPRPANNLEVKISDSLAQPKTQTPALIKSYMNTSKDSNRIVGWRLGTGKVSLRNGHNSCAVKPEVQLTRNHTRVKQDISVGSLPKIDTIRTLLVDDSPLMLKILSQIVATEDRFTVVGSATDGRQALRHALALDPELVLMGFHLSDMNGAQVTSCIKHIKNPPVVFMVTSDDSPSAREISKAAGADAFIVKSGDLHAQLKVRLQEWFGLAVEPNGNKEIKPKPDERITQRLGQAQHTPNSQDKNERPNF
jgi:membrane protein DedA with SNARE-associated domain/DNA-binding NarL/FixJ family response regulator